MSLSDYGLLNPRFEPKDGLATRAAKALLAMRYGHGEVQLDQHNVDQLNAEGLTQIPAFQNSLLLTVAGLSDRVVLSVYNLVTLHHDPVAMIFNPGPSSDISAEATPIDPIYEQEES